MTDSRQETLGDRRQREAKEAGDAFFVARAARVAAHADAVAAKARAWDNGFFASFRAANAANVRALTAANSAETRALRAAHASKTAWRIALRDAGLTTVGIDDDLR